MTHISNYTHNFTKRNTVSTKHIWEPKVNKQFHRLTQSYPRGENLSTGKLSGIQGMLHVSMMKEQLFRGGHILEDWQYKEFRNFRRRIMRHGDLMPAFNTIIDFFINSIFDTIKTVSRPQILQRILINLLIQFPSKSACDCYFSSTYLQCRPVSYGAWCQLFLAKCLYQRTKAEQRIIFSSACLEKPSAVNLLDYWLG